ncbi:hypothetical protein BGZ49_005180 [Haplosporangium sp. Z 27]|nr:hypothetical protein BGZ49_005180 [Haplosporangium sp. Z 27]
MIDIPELDAMICGKLSRRDLARCSLVSKQWHQTVIPYLWKDISHINDYSFNKHCSFRQIVLEDYLQQKRLHTQSADHPSSTLAKHCRWIKVFPSADQLLECLKPPENDSLHTQGDLEEHKTDPTAADLMRHLLDHCSDIVVPFLTLSDLKLSPYDYPDMLEIVVKYFLPRAQSLEFGRWDGISNIGPSFEPQKIKFLLSQCSSHLKVLSLSDLADIEYGEYGIPAEEYVTEDEYELDWSEEEFEDEYESDWSREEFEDEYEPDWSGEEFEEESESNKNEDNGEKGHRVQEQTRVQEGKKGQEELLTGFQLQQLILERYCENAKLNTFWSWLWKRCDSIQTLHLGSIINNVDSLVKGISDHMPNIRNIKFGLEIEEQSSPTDRCISNILSSCTGLRSVEVRPSAGFRGASKSALVKHYGTLQDLVVPSVDYESEELVALLSSTPNLRTLITMYDGDYMFGPVRPIDSEAFIDMDPSTGLLKPWDCEGSLKILRIWIGGIPRLGLTGEYGKVVKEDYPGQGLLIQSQVYKRLARFTKLEELWLGGNPSAFDMTISGDEWGLDKCQLDCLEMSLESGLDELKGLNELRELSLSFMSTKVGMKEVRWMAKNWPKLSIIRGINAQCEESEQGRKNNDKIQFALNPSDDPSAGVFPLHSIFTFKNPMTSIEIFLSTVTKRKKKRTSREREEEQEHEEFVIAFQLKESALESYLDDGETVLIVSGCRNGWKEVEVDSFVDFWDASISALVTRYYTLQVSIVPLVEFMSEGLVRLLSSAPNLKTLDTAYGGFELRQTCTHIKSSMFIDLDSASGSLKSRACESSLEVLKVKVRVIPRPEVDEVYEVIKESHPGEGQHFESNI